MKPVFVGFIVFLAMVGCVCAGLAAVAYYLGLFSSTSEFVQLLKSLFKPQEPPDISPPKRYWSDPESPAPRDYSTDNSDATP